jgi:rhodanese-related sulfurtransferase
VDDQLRTSDPHIHAVGDATEKVDALSGDQTLVPLANLANRQGRRAADAIAGRVTMFGSAQGTAIVKVFSLVAATTGANEKRLRASGRRYRAIHTHPGSHAGYYPGAETMALKLLVDADNDRILGAQAVGHGGVDKRIDVLATAIATGMTASALADLELAYAPPFGSAKDPINMLGYIAENLRDRLTSTVQWYDLTAERDDDFLVVDVRTRAEHARGWIPGALNIPVDELRERREELGAPGERHLVVYCEVGQRAHTAAMLLSGLGYDVSSIDGGWQTWQAGHHCTLSRASAAS